jgi:KDO2-lipid IV(A) lauroyltransferase
MSKSRFQIELEYLPVRLLLAIFRAVPLRAGLRLGPALGGFVYRFTGRLRRTGERNVELVFPELTRYDRAKLLRNCFRNFGRLLAVFSHFTAKNREQLKSLIDCEGLDRIDALSLFDHPLSFLVRRIDNPKIEALIDRARTQLGNRTIDKRAAAREMLQTLQAGETLGILVDLNTHEREGIFVDFFGRQASTTFVLAKIATRTGAHVLPIFAPWDEKRKRFLLKVDEPLDLPRTGDEEQDVRQLTQAFTKVIEKYIRQYPDQWLWIHRRWKTRPPGEPGIYD